MKKTNVILVMVCLIGLWVVSCVKDNETSNTKMKKVDKDFTAQLLKKMKTNGFEGTYLMLFKVGHKSTQCGGKCKSGPNGCYHQNCSGWGNECGGRATINISKNIPDDIYDVYYTGIGLYDYEPIEDSTFSMPGRSLFIEGENFENGYIYLNIPEQELVRDTESNQFIYKDITFSLDPLFENQ